MSNGGVENTRLNERQGDKLLRRPAADEFGRAVTRVAVAQICESVGFQGFKESALEALADIGIRYLCDLGKSSGFYANLAGRTHCNLFDIIRAFEDLASFQGFSGASGVGNCLVGSGTVKEMIEFVSSNDEIPFAQPVPRFPVVKDRRLIPSFVQMGETPPGKHIPAWLPAFPDPHTYVHTPMWNERTSDPRADKIEQARQRRKAERALLSLQQRLVTNGSAGASVSSAKNDDVKEVVKVEGNPFLATPLLSGEKDVSPVVLPANLKDEPAGKNQVSVLEAFAPAIDVMKGGGVCDDGDVERRLPSEKRPAIHFKFKTGKRFLGESLDLSLKQKGSGRAASWTGRDEERDDKKRRAEYILRQSMENPQELTQL